MSFDHLWFEHFLPKGSIHCKDESVNVCGEVGHGHTQLWPLLRKLDLNPHLNIKDMVVVIYLLVVNTNTTPQYMSNQLDLHVCSCLLLRRPS